MRAAPMAPLKYGGDMNIAVGGIIYLRSAGRSRCNQAPNAEAWRRVDMHLRHHRLSRHGR